MTFAGPIYTSGPLHRAMLTGIRVLGLLWCYVALFFLASAPMVAALNLVFNLTKLPRLFHDRWNIEVAGVLGVIALYGLFYVNRRFFLTAVRVPRLVVDELNFRDVVVGMAVSAFGYWVPFVMYLKRPNTYEHWIYAAYVGFGAILLPLTFLFNSWALRCYERMALSTKDVSIAS
jgi:hypothetical protein